MPPRASVVVSTYNQPAYLELVLLGFARQGFRDFELLIADDGSREETRELMERYARDYPVPLVHVWQPDEGFRKGRAVNLAVLRSRAPLLVFSDGDCVPSSVFVGQHVDALGPGTFAVGGHVRVSEEVSRTVRPETILAGEHEQLEPPDQRRGRVWMHWKNRFHLALGKRRKPKFYGLNFSVDRDSYFRVNGIDQTYSDSGREDSDLRNRMRLARIRPVSLWDRSVVYHLWHPRHERRDGWQEVDAYYYRKDLPARAPVGLAELARDEGIPLEAAARGETPVAG